MSELSSLVDLFTRVHGGDPWHGPSLLDTLKGVTAKQAAAHPVAGAHSIWELVLHVSAWRREVIRRIGGTTAGEPIEGDWPPVPAPTEENWRAALDDLQRSHEDVLIAVRSMPRAQLDEPVKDERNPALGTGLSFYTTIHGLVHHDVYHGAQMALLKRALQTLEKT
jgi:uncharacterized damage-inducible protein DinB